MEVLKIGLLGVAGVMLALQFKSNKPEFGLYIGFAICLLLFSFVVSGLSSVIGSMKVHKPGWSLFPHFAEGDRDYVYL